MHLSTRTQRKTHATLENNICHANIKILGRMVKKGIFSRITGTPGLKGLLRFPVSFSHNVFLLCASGGNGVFYLRDIIQ